MEEKALKAVGSIAATIVWAYVIFYLMGFGNVLLMAMQRTGNIGSVIIAVLGISVFFIPYMIINSIMKPQHPQKPPKS